MSTIILLLIGLGAGILSGIFGIGGGIVIVPSLIYLMKMTPQQAAGTSLAALVVPASAFVGAYSYYKAGHIQILPVLFIALGMAGGAFIGSTIATHVDGFVLKRAFAVLMVVVAVKMWFD